MTFVTVVVCGRRNCSRCTSWLHSHNFPPRKNKRGEVIGPGSVCHVCLRKTQRTLPPEKLKAQRAQQRAHMRKKRRMSGVPEHGPRVVARGKQGSVRREPFAEWMRAKVNLVGTSEFGRRTGLDERRIRAILSGWDKTGKGRGSRRHKLRQVDWVTFELVDAVMTAWGDHDLVNDLYPPTPPSVDADPPSSVPRFSSLLDKAPHIGKDDVPDVIGEYQRRRRARKPRAA